MRGALAAGALLAAVGMTATQASAAPPSTTSPVSGTPEQQFNQLSAQADKLNEQINNAKAELTAKNAQVAKAKGDVAKAARAEKAASAQEDQYRGQVDKLTDASFEGARLNQLSAVLTGTSVKDFLNRATDLQALADDNFAALSKFSNAVNAAKTAEERGQTDQAAAQTAAAAANALLAKLNAQKQQLTTQLSKVNDALHKLSSTEQASLSSDTGPAGHFIAPAGVAGAAMQIALGERGVPYRTGGASPSTGFDCSGLVMWSYAQAGMGGLPHSAAAQQQLGVAVSDADRQPGDLVFFGRPAYHVGIYVGNGMMVNAARPGTVVRVESIFSGYSGARRLGN
jgi:cell wall-associated NlpC family hydrolase